MPGMNHLRPFFLLPLTLLGAAFAQEPPSIQVPSIHVDVQRVNVGVIVTNARGDFVESLRREDFHIFDDGVEQPMTNFAAVDEPARVFLLIESGPAVYLLESGHIRASQALLDGLGAGDEVGVARYADSNEILLNFTRDKDAAYDALMGLRFNLGFASLNLSSSLAQTLDWLARLRGKKTLILLSTGVDTSPVQVRDSVLSKLRISDVRILAVSLGGELRPPEPQDKRGQAPAPSTASEEFAQADRLMRALAAASGGRVYSPRNPREFADAYRQIALLVRHEYSLEFAPPARDGKIHAVEVRVTAKTSPVQVDHRQAYLAPLPH